MTRELDDNTMISFIIPAYNAEATIERAINSITSRLDDYEVIVVENGSTDRTTEIAESIAQDNKKVKVIHSERGVSKARNKGIKQAAGKWVAFVDADDTWEANEKDLAKTIEKDSSAELIVYSYFKNNKLIANDYPAIDKVINKDKMGSLLKWMMTRSTIRMNVWGKLYRRDFLVDNELYFDEALRMSEDSELMLRVLLKCTVAKVSVLPVYRVYTHAPSATRSIDDSRIDAYIDALVKAQTDLEGKYYEPYRDYVIAHINLICVHNIYNFEEKKRWADRNKQLKELLRHKIVQEEITNLTLSSVRDIHYIPSYCFSKKIYSIRGMICMLKAKNNRRKYRKNKSNKQL